MKTILYIAPHLSTGGLPQYLAKKIEELKDIYNIYVIEYDDVTGGVLVVQKNRIKNLIGDNLLTIPWGGDKKFVIETIKRLNPDIVHLEEMPEYFMADSIAEQIYTKERRYKIFETSHDSSFDVNTKRFIPDKFILVSKFQSKMLSDLKIDSEVVEYPIEYKERPDRYDSLKKLGLDPEYKHVLHVGLFTPRKNQAEFFEYARMFEGEKIMFHSVGNTADNFKYYWEPLLNNIPKNLIVHGERSDVDKFYSAMDLFLFTSKGTVKDKETMPLVIREAISWELPTLIYNLPVYENYFDEFSKVKYLKFDDFEYNYTTIKNLLNNNNNNNNEYLNESEEVVVISTYPNTQRVIEVTLNCILSAHKSGRKVILTSHIPVPKILEETADYVLVDKNNLLTKHTFYSYSYWNYSEYYTHVNLKAYGNDIYHGPACYTNYYNGACLAKNLGFKKVFFLNYDYEIKDRYFLDYVSKKLNDYKIYCQLREGDQEGPTVTTWFMGIEPDFYINHFPLILKEEQYTQAMYDWGSETNSLENMMFHGLKPVSNKVFYEKQKDFDDLVSKTLYWYDFSRVEYFTLLSVKDNPSKFAIWFSVNNATDSRVLDLYMDDNFIETINVNGNNRWYKIIDFQDKTYKIKGLFFDKKDEKKEQIIEVKEIILTPDYFYNNLNKNGFIELK
jgi:glycosyltransferase involved in cell wall biosynthesis